jgi:selenide, water dikinase
MHSDWPLTRDLVLIGGGHTHALVLKQWGMNPLAGARVTLINPQATSPYTGMLPGHVAGHFTRDALDIDLVRLARFAGARIVFDTACGIDREAKLIHLENRSPVRYDVASIDIGVTAELSAIPGFSAHAHSVKPLGPFARAWATLLHKAALQNTSANCAVIGAGVAGVELALAMAHRLRTEGRAAASVTLIETRPEILGDIDPAARRILRRALSQLGVHVRTGVQVLCIHADRIENSDGSFIPVDFTVSAAGAKPYAWLRETGLSHTDGFINVGADLRTLDDNAIFAAGDCAHLTHAPRPKAGVYAVRAAPVLTGNLRAALSGETMRPYHPQTDYLKLVSTGAKSAVGVRAPLAVSGPWVWDLKNRIDAAFMARLRDFPPMPAADLPLQRALDDDAGALQQPLCGGCGSKVGRASLIAALGGHAPGVRGDIVAGIGDDAAVLQIGQRLQVISTDHLRAFVEDPYVMARITAVHALGDIWAMGAAPQSALLSLIIPRMSERMQSDTIAEVARAVCDVLREAGADLVGGHTSIGQELTIGLTVTGLLDAPAIGHAGAQPGDAIILTKPIGTGVILAADMRGLARGDDVAFALGQMQRPLATAARLLAPAARAMTDVTGFGLAGHLMSILQASGVSARISLGDVPLLPGAASLAARGIKSSLWPANANLDRQISRPASAISDLIYDPQTAGGMLAVVPAGRAGDILAAFAATGETAFVIGSIEDGAPGVRVV